MSDLSSKPCTAFEGHRLLRSGPLAEVAPAVKAALEAASTSTILVFDDETARIVDLDLRGSDAEIVARLSQATPPEDVEPKGRGRPKLGVVPREVTLLPRQWEWLAAQPGGASATLRRLVDEARKRGEEPQRRRKAQEAAYRFMQAIGGDFPGFEEATRALFANDQPKLAQCIADWPEDIRAYALQRAFGGGENP